MVNELTAEDKFELTVINPVAVTGPMLTNDIGTSNELLLKLAGGQMPACPRTHMGFIDVNNQLVPTVGTCGVMGTASTMALITEALGIMLPNGACAPAVSAERKRIAEETGRVAVEIASKDLRPSKFLTIKNFQNALTVLSAIGGSTNGIVHLTAIAGRLGFDLNLNDFDKMTKNTPMIVDLKPSGSGYMEDLFKSGASKNFS